MTKIDDYCCDRHFKDYTDKINKLITEINLSTYEICLCDLILYAPLTIFQLCSDGSTYEVIIP